MNCGFRIADFGLRIREFGVWSLEFGVWSLEFGVRGSELGSDIAESGLRIGQSIESGSTIPCCSRRCPLSILGPLGARSSSSVFLVDEVK